MRGAAIIVSESERDGRGGRTDGIAQGRLFFPSSCSDIEDIEYGVVDVLQSTCELVNPRERWEGTYLSRGGSSDGYEDTLAVRTQSRDERESPVCAIDGVRDLRSRRIRSRCVGSVLFSHFISYDTTSKGRDVRWCSS
jgi:hypothetical protein